MSYDGEGGELNTVITGAQTAVACRTVHSTNFIVIYSQASGSCVRTTRFQLHVSLMSQMPEPFEVGGESITLGAEMLGVLNQLPWCTKSIAHGSLGLELCSSSFRSLMNRFSIGWTFFLMPPT